MEALVSEDGDFFRMGQRNTLGPGCEEGRFLDRGVEGPVVLAVDVSDIMPSSGTQGLAPIATPGPGIEAPIFVGAIGRGFFEALPAVPAVFSEAENRDMTAVNRLRGSRPFAQTFMTDP